MVVFKRNATNADSISTSPQSSPERHEKDIDAVHAETASATGHTSKWKLNKAGEGDVAMALFDNPDELHEPVDAMEEKKLVRKIDFMILPYLAVCYAFFYIDKTTLSYAAIFGIRDDLHLVGTQYSWLSSIFYFGFLAWALPTNLLIQRLPVGRYLGFNICLWGVFLMLQAAATNFASLAALRALAGAAEACSDPSFMLITSMWYTRRQQPVRMGLWYTANGFGIALGGLLGFGIGNIKGGLPSWKFEFIIIGALCMIWGVVMFIFLPDSPVTAKGLTLREKRIAIERLRENQTGVENKVGYLIDHVREKLQADSRTALQMVSTSRSLHGHQTVPLLRIGHCLQLPERWHQQLWYHNYQGLRLQHARYYPHADPIRLHHRHLDSDLRLSERLYGS